MLDAMRQRATSWVVRLLLILLCISFGIWGIGDIFRAPRETGPIAEVDGPPINGADLSREANNSFDRLAQQLQGKIQRSPGIMEGLVRQALQQSIAGRLIDAHIRALGLSVADTTLAQTIRDQPAFQTAGKFDRSRFDYFLRSSGLSEEAFLSQLRGDVLRSQVVDAVTGPAAGSATLARAVAAWQDEQRRGQALVVEAASMQTTDPTEKDLQTYLDAHADSYKAPERRSADILILSAADLAGEINVGEEEIKKAYEEDKGHYTTPERRWFLQLLAPDKPTIDEAAKKVAAGESFAKIADELGSKVSTTNVGPVTSGQLPDPLDKAAFALNQDQVSQPLQTSFGWHLLRLVKMEPEHQQPLSEVQEQIRKEIALRKAEDELPTMANTVDDAVGGGATLAEAADKVGVQLHKLPPIDRAGDTKDGKRPAGVELTSEMLDEIFSAAKDDTSLLIHGKDNSYFIFHLNEIQPASTRPLAEVKDSVTKAWQQEEQRKEATKQAETLLKDAQGGAALDAARQGRSRPQAGRDPAAQAK